MIDTIAGRHWTRRSIAHHIGSRGFDRQTKARVRSRRSCITAGALRKQSWLNAFVALGATGAAILLMLWVSTCTNGAF